MFNILYVIIYVIIWRNYWNNERKLSLELVYGSWGLWGLLISSLLLVRLRLSNQCRSTKSNIAFSSVFREHSKFIRLVGTENFNLIPDFTNIGWKHRLEKLLCWKVWSSELPNRKLGLWKVPPLKNWNVNFPTSMRASQVQWIL